MARNIQDALLNRSKALPAANATAVTDSIDLGAISSDRSLRPPEGVDVVLAVPATPSLVEAKTITLSIEDSADNSSFAAIAALATGVVTGAAAAAGGPAFSRTVTLPQGTRRYIRGSATVLVDGGSNIAVSFTLKLVF